MSVSTSMAQDASESETVALSGGGAEDGGEEAIPGRIGRYSVIERIGRGGMGSVYRAYDAKLRREVALKQVRADRLGPETELRLVQEAQAMARLSHPNVVAVYDVEVGTSLTLAMEYVPGRSVAQWLEHRRSWREVLEVFVAAGRGLAAAHSVGLVHRDFKPANVLLADDGTTKVTDFGLAKPDDASATGALGEEPPSVDGLPSDSSVPITRADTVMGTPKYMAPEQHSGARADARCDQYAFCVSLWQALTGTHPFDRGSYPELAEAKLAGPPSWPRSPVVPGRIVRAITRGLQPDPRYRHASMSTLLGALEPALAPRRRWWSVGAGVIALGGVIAAAWVGRSERCTGAEAELAGVWDEDASTRVQRALLGHELAYAKSTWSRVQAGLDGYAREWKRLHRDACEAATIRGEQSSAVMDLRMQCLQRAKAELAERVAVLASADAEVLPRAVGMVDDLPALPECADVARLTAESPPPTDPEEAA
ncbi:MAG: serine/threonine protein kinase, partial [Myxococcales bacterium]|nr:serine/threonine protein kinase [Myxococcales bacterium]